MTQYTYPPQNKNPVLYPTRKIEPTLPYFALQVDLYETEEAASARTFSIMQTIDKALRKI